MSASSSLYGREREEEALRRLVEGAAAGSGGALLLTGGPGLGRTALLDQAVTMAGLTVVAGRAAAAKGFLVLKGCGAGDESRLPYAGLHALLHTLDGSPALDGTPPSGLALPVAVLELLDSLERPVLVCVDDVHLLDGPSRQTLFFLARRLAGRPVAMVLTARGELGPVEGIPVLDLAPLDSSSSRALLADLVPGMADDVGAALDRAAHGVPLALAELAGALHRQPPPEVIPRGGRLWRAHTERLSALPCASRRVLLLVAADPELDCATLVRACGADLGALEPAEAAGLVRPAGGRWEIADPHLRTVIYHGACLADRLAAHRTLARALSETSTIDVEIGGTVAEAGTAKAAQAPADGRRRRLAWHRAAALDGPAERLADELATAAPYGSAPEGSFPDPSRAYERAAELTARTHLKAARMAAAARHAWSAGRPWRARDLLSRLGSLAVPEEVRGRAGLVRGSLELRLGETASACEELLTAARSLLDHDRALAVRTLVRAAEASYLAADNRRFVAVARQAAALRSPDDPPEVRLMFDYLAGVSATFRGRHAEAAAPLHRVLELAPAVDNPSVLVWATVASLMLGEDRQAVRLSARAIATARARGAVSVVPQVLETMIHVQIWRGRYASVAEHAMEGLRLARETGQLNSAAQHLGWLAVVAAVQGDAETCRIRATAAMELADAHGVGVAGALGDWALGHLDLAAGRTGSAAERLRPRGRHDHVVIRIMATPNLVEAAVRAGDRERAESAMPALDRWTGSMRNPDRRALAARCHALLAAPGAARESFREAIELHRHGACEFERARTLLLYGGALRRERQPGAAREHLQEALEAFERYGTRLWAEQARAELRASGETVGPPRPASLDTLTAQQLQIARMVAEGATNREVAAQLFLSPRTVDHHLRNVFTRLGIRSRVDLARLLS
ncbi:helix-turn-helix transcriptional regulator [Nonomuraea soli]|uniref:DNA-binding CsgD family transcriptional regulator n=1 Tax=Nonomuraea soli TaxID=1032476 RepID=A0A7W0CK95_9ACTN|nr:LuxR C-terminal-related transcriptional regulator [Nonomuraea soli]MBA2892752.1 DNA-binding CsgD family transcriptional regulator [Nonomuraea soli]